MDWLSSLTWYLPHHYGVALRSSFFVGSAHHLWFVLLPLLSSVGWALANETPVLVSPVFPLAHLPLGNSPVLPAPLQTWTRAGCSREDGLYLEFLGLVVHRSGKKIWIKSFCRFIVRLQEINYHLSEPISDEIVEQFRVDDDSSDGFLIDKRQEL